MVYAGADGETREQMARTLHFEGDEKELHDGVSALAADLNELARVSQLQIAKSERRGGPNTPIEITTANRLFGQEGQDFEAPFVDLLAERYQARLMRVDFLHQREKARDEINQWVERQTQGRISDLIPAGALDEQTRLVLTNAIFMKAPWAEEFQPEPDQPFFINSEEEIRVDGMQRRGTLGFAEITNASMITIPYHGGGLQFLLILPKLGVDLHVVESGLNAGQLRQAARLDQREIILHMPKFKLSPGRVMLSSHLKQMGMPSAFDQPVGSANFSRMAIRKPDDYLFIGEVVHQAFIDVNCHGTEAAAATAVLMMRSLSVRPSEESPLEIRIDRPFLFAVQHVASGTCLFLGRLVDPR
jgi:serpin B